MLSSYSYFNDAGGAGEEDEGDDYDDGGDSASDYDSENGDSKPPPTTFLLLGRSTTGKSYLCKYLVNAFADPDRPVYTLNDRTATCRFIKITVEQAKVISNCCVVAEDIISATRPLFEVLQLILNYKGHHDSISPCILISHSIYKNSIYSLLPFIRKIYLSAVRSSLNSLKAVLNFFDFEPSEKLQVKKALLSCSQKFCFLAFDVDKREWSLVRAEKKKGIKVIIANIGAGGETGASADSELELRIRSNASQYLNVLARKEVANQIFNMIFPSLPLDKLNPQDLSVRLRLNGSDARVSLVDYCAQLTSNDADDADSDEESIGLLLKFHRYLRRRGIFLPSCYIVNQRFK